MLAVAGLSCDLLETLLRHPSIIRIKTQDTKSWNQGPTLKGKQYPPNIFERSLWFWRWQLKTVCTSTCIQSMSTCTIFGTSFFYCATNYQPFILFWVHFFFRLNKHLTQAQNQKFIISAEYQGSYFLVIFRWSYELILYCDSSTWTYGSTKKNAHMILN